MSMILYGAVSHTIPVVAVCTPTSSLVATRIPNEPPLFIQISATASANREYIHTYLKLISFRRSGPESNDNMYTQGAANRQCIYRGTVNMLESKYIYLSHF